MDILYERKRLVIKMRKIITEMIRNANRSTPFLMLSIRINKTVLIFV